jgi:hypothetical protein
MNADPAAAESATDSRREIVVQNKKNAAGESFS